MGDRCNVIVKCGNEQVVLYSHWDGHNIEEKVKKALSLQERWNDFQYLTRIIFCHMVSDLKGTTGYGITTKVHDGESNIITIDVDEQKITIGNSIKTLEEFIS